MIISLELGTFANLSPLILKLIDDLSLCPLFFIKFLFFRQMIAIQKLGKMFFLLSKKLFPY